MAQGTDTRDPLAVAERLRELAGWDTEALYATLGSRSAEFRDLLTAAAALLETAAARSWRGPRVRGA